MFSKKSKNIDVIHDNIIGFGLGYDEGAAQNFILDYIQENSHLIKETTSKDHYNIMHMLIFCTENTTTCFSRIKSDISSQTLIRLLNQKDKHSNTPIDYARKDVGQEFAQKLEQLAHPNQQNIISRLKSIF